MELVSIYFSLEKKRGKKKSPDPTIWIYMAG